jgi:hypothetical protein
MLMNSNTQATRNSDLDSTALWVFRLSYFLLADRRDALSVLHQATSRLYVTALTQKKRQAKRPKNEVHKKLSLTPRQLLQYLTYLCAEPYEGMQEREHRSGARNLTLEDMLVRYVKHLVLLYLEHNSFYATVGQSCVLFDLCTRQAERLYEVLVQGSPAHLDTKGDYSVRDAKREIRQRLGRRFEGFLTGHEGARREQLFVPMADPGPHFRFVKQCFHQLQPVEEVNGFSGRWHLPAHFDPTAYDLAELQYDEGNADPSAEQAAESRRLHAVTHPCCWARLLRASSHDYSRRRVVLPEFKLDGPKADKHMPPTDRQNPPELTPAELKGLSEMLKSEARRRKGLFASRLSISVDGSTRRSWEVYAGRVLTVRVEPSARVLEVSARDAEGELLLAQHLLSFGNASDAGAQEASVVTLESGQEFTFSTARPRDAGEGLDVTIRFRETRLDRALAGYLSGRGWLGGMPHALAVSPAKLKAAAAFAALLVVILAGWWAARGLLSPRQSHPEEVNGGAPVPTRTTSREVVVTPTAEPLRPRDETEKRNGGQTPTPHGGTRHHEPPSPEKNLSGAASKPKKGAGRATGRAPEVVLVIQDGGRLVTLDGRGRHQGLEGLPGSWQREIAETLLARRVKRPPVLDVLEDGARGTLRGSSDGAPFDLLGPYGTAVERDRPTFRWGELRGAASYTVAVFDSRLNKVTESAPLSANVWTPARPLRRGEIYYWQVTAVLDGKEVVSPGAASPEAKFAVVSEGQSEELKRARAAFPGSHLTLGVLYARAGLLDEAEREFRSLVESDPKSSAAAGLLRSVRELRGVR